MSVWGLSHTNQYKLLCVENRAGCDVTEVGRVPLGRLRMAYYSVDHRERWCSGLWSSSRPQISVPAFSICHFPNMWVSLVNTLNPRPNEHIMASCSVGNRLQLKRDWARRVRSYIICAPQSEGPCGWIVWLQRQYVGRITDQTKSDYSWEKNCPLIRDYKALFWAVLCCSHSVLTPPVPVLQEGLVIISHLTDPCGWGNEEARSVYRWEFMYIYNNNTPKSFCAWYYTQSSQHHIVGIKIAAERVCWKNY